MGDDQSYCSYEEFGAQFFAQAITRERVLSGVAGLAGQPIEFGPIHAGPGGVARVTARGAVGQADATEVPGDEIAFHVVLPVSLDLELNLQVDTHRFHAELLVPLDIVARATRDVTIVIDIAPPQARDVTVELKAAGMRASLLQRVAGIDAEMCRFVAKYVAREITKPEIAALRRVDVAELIEATWSRMGAVAAAD